MRTERLLLIAAFFILVLGLSFNFRAIQTNNGFMPYESESSEIDAKHIPFTDRSQVNNYYLLDIIKIRTEKYTLSISIGDILIVAGLLFLLTILAVYEIKDWRNE